MAKDERNPNEDMFWTDIQQASDRLRGTTILYDDLPYYVSDIVPGEATKERPGMPRAILHACGEGGDNLGKPTRRILNSPKFKRFRTLPNLGWMNSRRGAVWLTRRPVAGGRSHGYTDNCITTLSFLLRDNGKYSEVRGDPLSNLQTQKGFLEMHQGVYPTLEATLANIKPNTSIAYNREFCVVRDENGFRWMYFRKDRVGLFSSSNNLCLSASFAHLRETIMESPSFTLDNITEY